MSVYLPPSITGFKPRRLVFSTWIDHLPFACDIIAATRPHRVIELGVYNGLSYFAFCQAMQEQGVQGECFGVDTWEGEAHNGEYDESIYNGVRAHNDEHYAGFSTLIRGYFSDALQQFEDNSVDLIHIDGFHSYEAVREDFTTWYPKVAPGGIMLFHDVRARIKDFGVWRYWNEIRTRYPSFTFKHCFGLGVLRKPGGAPPQHPLLRALFSDDAQTRHNLQRFYAHAACQYELRIKAERRKDGGLPRK